MSHWGNPYQDSYPDMLIEHMSMGYSFRSFGAIVKKGITTLDRWTKEHEQFGQAKQIGEACALFFFERLQSAGAMGHKLKIKDKDGNEKEVTPNSSFINFPLSRRFREVYPAESANTTVNVEQTDKLVIVYGDEKEPPGGD